MFAVDSAGIHKTQAVLDARATVGNFGEIVLAEFLLLLEAEGAVVGGDDLQRVLREALPELFLMPFFAERRSEDVFRAFKTGRVHILERKIQVLRTSFGVRGEAETCPQYLYLSLENMDAPGFEGAKYVFTPPLREKWHQEKLWQGLAKDTLQVVSTDHCPFCFKEQKELGKDDFTKIPNGGPGIEHRLSLVYTGGVHGKHFSPNRFVQLVSTTPAKLFGLYPRKGTLAVGSDADIVIFDPNHEEVISAKTHHMRVDYSMFEGIKIKGAPKTVFSRGRAVIDSGKFVGRPGSGQFLRRQTYAGL